MKLDYSINNFEERKAIVEKILEEDPHPTKKYLEILSDYLVFCMSKEEKKEKKILTENRLTTIDKRETSYEGIVSRFENGEDGVYNILSSEKNTIFRPKISITEEDRKDIPELEQTADSINFWTNYLEAAEGKDAFVAKKALIESRKEQYTIKSSRKPVVARGLKPNQQPRIVHKTELDGYITFDENGYCVPHGITLVDPKVCGAILRNYSYLHTTPDKDTDLWKLLEEFDIVAKQALEKYPIYRTIIECKINEFQNVEIQKILLDTYGSTHSLEYISSLWRKKIPEVIASQAEDNYLDWYFTEVEYGKWKKCSRCGQIKLAHNKYFSKNSTSKDGFYSICKCCRNKKGGGAHEKTV